MSGHGRVRAAVMMISVSGAGHSLRIEGECAPLWNMCWCWDGVERANGNGKDRASRESKQRLAWCGQWAWGVLREWEWAVGGEGVGDGEEGWRGGGRTDCKNDLTRLALWGPPGAGSTVAAVPLPPPRRPPRSPSYLRAPTAPTLVPYPLTSPSPSSSLPASNTDWRPSTPGKPASQASTNARRVKLHGSLRLRRRASPPRARRGLCPLPVS